MDYYNKLNSSIQNSINDYGLQYHLKYFEEIVKLAYIIIENTPKLDLKEYSSNVSLNTSIQTVVNFFNSIKPEYSYMFQNILQEKNIQHIEQKEVNEIVETETQEDNCKIVKSPMVGTFYLKPDPNSNPYVEIGKKVKKGDILCIIEAMKLMNEIECEFDGEIAEILVKDGEMVEYGKPLFKIK